MLEAARHSAVELAPGTRLKGGAYRVCSLIGRGGFGLTYRAFDVGNGVDVAVKECFPPGCERAENNLEVRPNSFSSHATLEAFCGGFHTQAARLKRLEHPAIVPLLDCFDDMGTTFLVMPLLEGPTLLEFIETNGPLAPDEALNLFQILADALSAIHDAGFLHLDVKPENVILVNEKPILVDFDLLTSRGGQNEEFVTRPLALASQIGTPGYAPLEQYGNQAPLSPATDVYALGATLFHALTGRAPQSAVDRAAGVPFSVKEKLREIPVEERVSNALESALELRADARPASMQALRELLAPEFPAADLVAAPNSFSAPAPNDPILPVGFYRVVLDTKSPQIPSICACCAAPEAESEWTLKSPSGRWALPICAFCARHQRANSQGGFVTFWGTVASVAFAALSVWISIASGSWWPILLGMVAMLINFSAMSYGALKNSRAEEMLGPDCCDVSEPATFVWNGRVQIWRFRNGKFAEAFKQANIGTVR